MNTIILENETLNLEFDRKYGALVGLTAVESGWEILNRPHLGLSFRLLVPLKGRRNNPVFGERQRITSVKVAPNGHMATFTWDGVMSEYSEPLEIKITLHVSLTAKKAVYAMTISNQSEYSRKCLHPISWRCTASA